MEAVLSVPVEKADTVRNVAPGDIHTDFEVANILAGSGLADSLVDFEVVHKLEGSVGGTAEEDMNTSVEEVVEEDNCTY